ncbi:MAG TPA: tripartite tricarboxylate transporter substrate binding protein [Usitatibacter sp.]|jgi:tripartite-type tricarboxylate transporter receptor subunit TctC|nr:tripartite tricarboxylate transporter substrate binding protein [Usitatibacter sp.]
MRRLVIAAALAALAVASPAFAQKDFPNRPVTLTVGFAPGGGTDTTARIVAKKITEDLGVAVVVENRAGAGGEIAAQHIAGAPPDGYTIHLSSVGPLAVAPAMNQKLPYDPKRDIAPITMGVIFPNVFVVPASSPFKSVADLVAAARKEPGQLTYGSSGVGGAAHLAGELLKQDAKIDMIHVPYKGGGPAMTDLLAARVNMYPAVPSTALPQIKAGKIRAIATTGSKRTAMLPDVPTVAEQGFPGFEAVNWYAFVAPAKTPTEILDFWNRELVKVLSDPEVKAQLDKQGLEPAPGTREELAKYIDRETAKWGKVVREAHITAN